MSQPESQSCRRNQLAVLSVERLGDKFAEYPVVLTHSKRKEKKTF